MKKINQNKPSIGIIGVGSIAKEHARALIYAGFHISCCTGSPGSLKAKTFADNYKIEKVFCDSNELLQNHDKFDCLLIACSTNPTLDILKLAVKLKKPVLVEKPITLNYKDFSSLNLENEKVRVGYNRRFYSTVQLAKKFVKKHSPCLISIELPDHLNFKLKKIEQDYKSLKDNSIHALDIINYIDPDFEILQVNEYLQPDNSFGKIVILKSSNDNTCVIKLNWNSPSNFNLSIEALPYKLELMPFEKYKLYKGLSVLEPSEKSPIRQYMPKVIDQSDVFSKSKDFKPGFLPQAEEFLEIVRGGKPIHSANLKDAKKASLLASNIIDFKR